MSHFLSNLPCPSRSRIPHGSSATSGGQPPVSSSSPAMVPTPEAAVNPPPNIASSLIPAHGINEDSATSVEPSESAPQVDKGKQPMDESLQHKRKWVVSIKSDESIPGEGFMADARCTGRKEEFFKINLGANPKGQLADVVDHCRQLPLHLRLPIQWLNECLSKVDWKDLR